MEIVHCREEHLESIRAIYNHYVEHSTITFEESPLSLEQLAERVKNYTDRFPWLVGVDNNEVVGYAYGSPWAARCAYRNSVEVSCYLDKRFSGRGWGKRLYRALIAELRERDFHVIIAGVALPNPASEKMQVDAGFEKVGHFKEIGFKFGKWLDVAYWQLRLKEQ